MGIIRTAYHRILLTPEVPRLFSFARRDCATVFMLHRFADRERGIEGLDTGVVRSGLAYLRRNGYEMLSLADVYARLAGGGPPLRGAVAFTLDDGYMDQADIAGPLFAEFDCPVTTFVTVGFLDGALWMWWDKIEHIFCSTRRRSLSVLIGGESVSYHWDGEGSGPPMGDFIGRCKVVGDEEKHRAIIRLAESADVDLPTRPPVRYAPMTWDDLRTREEKGMTFGPHTVTHPVLSRATADQADREISESWQRLCGEARRPVPVFCYPNGQLADFGPREIDILMKNGLVGAVVGEPGYADPASFGRSSDAPFKLRRFPFPEDISDLVQRVSGIERCKQFVRRQL